jgi:uncharacterized protein (DUF2141 family)
MKRKARSDVTRVWIVGAILGALGWAGSSAQSNLGISGTVFAAQGSSVQNAVVIACLLENDTCNESKTGVQQINANGSSVAYRIDNLENAAYLMLAWRDLNGNGEADTGDEIGLYQQGGKPALLTPPASRIDLRLQRFTGDLDTLLAQADDPSSVAPQQQPVTPAPASSGLTFTGRVLPQPNSSLIGTQVFAAIFVNDNFDSSRTKGVRANDDGSFTLSNLEKTRYALFAWRDASDDGKLGAGDEIGAYLSSGKPALTTPPLTNITLQLRPFSSSEFDAVRNLFLPANTSSNSLTPNTTISFKLPQGWRSTGGGNYIAAFGKDDTIYRQGRLDVTVFPARAKSGALLEQTRAIWKSETKGALDVAGTQGAVFARRLPSGLNVGVTFGTARIFDNAGQDRDFPKLSTYSVMFLVETGNQVTPIFCKMTRAESSLGYITYETEGRPQMLEFINSLKSTKPVNVPPLYTEKDFVGKWKETSGTYNATDWYNASGIYSTSTWTSTAFTLKLDFKKGGVGQYFAQLTTVNTGVFNTQKEDEPMKWRISGDQMVIERPGSKRKSSYQLYGIGKDARGKPVILTRYLVGNQTIADLDSSPEDTWVVDN